MIERALLRAMTIEREFNCMGGKQIFPFPGAIPTKSKVRSTADAKRLDFGGEQFDKLEFGEENMR